jgi:3-hydroxybutyryl-CoA dehydrogenase
MSGERIEVLVAGSGVMGRGIAASFASAGIATGVLSRDPSKVEGMAEGVAVVADLPAEAPDLIIETIPEVIDLKHEFNARVEAAYGGATVIGSNTSSLPLQELADRLKHPEKYCGIHYFQPADVVPVVELARVAQTGDSVVDTGKALLERSGKYVIVLSEPIEGLLVNRLQHAILHEAYYLIERGICNARDIDEVGKQLLGPRMSVTGLIEQKDLSGLDTHALAQAALLPHLDHSPQPHRVVQDKYAAGNLGVKTGLGFYDWRGVDVPAYRSQTSGLLSQVLEVLDSARQSVPPLAPEQDD